MKAFIKELQDFAEKAELEWATFPQGDESEAREALSELCYALSSAIEALEQAL